MTTWHDPYLGIDQFAKPAVVQSESNESIANRLQAVYGPGIQPTDLIAGVSDRTASEIEHQRDAIRGDVRSELLALASSAMIDQLAGLWNVRRLSGEADADVIARMRWASAKHYQALTWSGVLAMLQDQYPAYRGIGGTVLQIVKLVEDVGQLSPAALTNDEQTTVTDWLADTIAGPSVSVPAVVSTVRTFDWEASIELESGINRDIAVAGLVRAGQAWINALLIGQSRYASGLIADLAGVAGVALVSMTRFQETGTAAPAVADVLPAGTGNEQWSCYRGVAETAGASIGGVISIA